MPLTDDGYTALRGADLLVGIQDDFVANLAADGLPTDIDFEHDIVFGHLTATLAVRLDALCQASQAIYDAFDPNAATGLTLDSIGLLRGVPRLGSTYSQVTVTLTGTNGTVVQEGDLVEDAAKVRWAMTADTTISGGTGSVIARCQTAGAVALAPSTLQIVTPRSGWTVAANAASATVGRDLEIDSAYAIRQQESLSISGGRNKSALRAQLLATVDTLTAVVVLSNEDDAEATVQGVDIPAHGVAVVLYPDTLTDDEKAEVAQVLYDQVVDGAAMAGAVEATVTDTGDDVARTVRWDWATTTAVDVAVTGTYDPDLTNEADAEAAAIAAVEAQFAALNVGDALRKIATYGLLADVTGLDAATVTFDGAGLDIEPTLAELLIAGTVTAALTATP